MVLFSFSFLKDVCAGAVGKGAAMIRLLFLFRILIELAISQVHPEDGSHFSKGVGYQITDDDHRRRSKAWNQKKG